MPLGHGRPAMGPRGRAGGALAPRTGSVRLTADRVHEAGEALGRALLDDPLLRFVVPDPAKRTRVAMARTGVGLVRYGQRFGEVYTTPPPIDGVAIWLRPEDPVAAALRPVRTLLLTASLGLDLAGSAAFLRAWSQLERRRRRDTLGRHWHLAFLGVSPIRRETGIEDALIEPILTRADAEGVPCFLVGMQAKTVLGFVRAGFRVVGEGDLTGGGPRFWSMRREPTG